MADWFDEKVLGALGAMLIGSGALLARGWNKFRTSGDTECFNRLADEISHMNREMRGVREDVQSNTRTMDGLRQEVSQLRVEIGKVQGRLD